MVQKKHFNVEKDTYFHSKVERLYCTDFTSVGNEEWICHTCLSALRENKIPKLSVANGMKWAKQTSRAEFAPIRRKVNSTAYPIYAD